MLAPCLQEIESNHTATSEPHAEKTIAAVIMLTVSLNLHNITTAAAAATAFL